MNNNQNNQDDPNRGNKRRQYGYMLVMALLISWLAMTLISQVGKGSNEEISYNKFLNMVERGEVKKVKIGSEKITIYPKEAEEDNASISELVNQNKTYTTGVVDDPDLKTTLYEAGVEFEKEIPNTGMDLFWSIFLNFILPFIVIWVLLSVVMRRISKNSGGGFGGLMGVGKSNAKVYMEKKTGVTFADVAGEEEAKESLQEVVDFLHDPQKYTSIGAKLPRGALLVGPPGTGKTLLAKAVAGEAGVPFFSISGSAFVEMYVGVGASRVRDLFKQAQSAAPCIVFIDEIDAIGKSRDNALGSNDEREQTLNQLLAEMDGFDTEKGLLILAATNRPEVLDPALLRPGRFDRRIVVERPDLKGRIGILKVHSKDVHLDETVDLEEIALATSGAVGSDLANMINEAAIAAVKHGRRAVSQQDLFEAVEVVLVGKEKKDRVMSQEERRIVSYHEVGHALVAALQKDSEPVQKITIVPRTMGALGYVMQTPEEEKFLNTEKELKAMLVHTLAGRAAEEVVFDTVTTGASNDIEKATKIARAMVTQYGMSKKFGLIGLEQIGSKYLDGRPVSNCSPETETDIDREVMRMLHDAYEEAKRLLEANRPILDKIAAFLIEKETITGKEFMEIFHAEKGIAPEEGGKKSEERIKMKEVEGYTLPDFKYPDDKKEETEAPAPEVPAAAEEPAKAVEETEESR